MWLKDKDLEVIIPQGLRERDFKTMPSRERKTAGAVFGTNAGKRALILARKDVFVGLYVII